MIWKPARRLGIFVGSVVLLTIVGIQAFLVYSIVQQEPGASLFLTGILLLITLPLLLLWCYWFYELLSLRYLLDRNALIIEYGTARHIVPLANIQRVLHGEELAGGRTFHGVGWPGYLKGRQRIRQLGELSVHSTEPLERQLIVATPTMAYGISPTDAEAFVRALQARRALGPVRPLEQRKVSAGSLNKQLWRDRGFWTMAATALLINVTLLGMIMFRYPYLPPRLVLDGDTWNEAGRIVSREWLLIVPTVGAIMVMTNTLLGIWLHQREQVMARLLAALSIALQPVLYLATIGVLG